MPTPFFTIIIPTYNSAATLKACIDSVLDQQFRDFELLIVDAVSTDETVKIVNSYSLLSDSIRLLSEKDKGIYDAMNKSIQLANPSWLYFLGSDDQLYDNTILQKVYSRIRQLPGTEIVYGDVWSERFKGIYDGPFDYNKILKKNISHQAIFFRKEVFEKTGNFDLRYKAQADWDHNLKWLLAKDIKKEYIDVVIALYADGGFSSVTGDDIFYRDLRLNYLQYGRNSLPVWKKIIVGAYTLLKLVKRADRGRLLRLVNLFK
jgi:glycosyltransferase involved in cell wall biosynthesis